MGINDGFHRTSRSRFVNWDAGGRPLPGFLYGIPGVLVDGRRGCCYLYRHFNSCFDS